MREITIRLDKVQTARVEYYFEGNRPHREIQFTIDESRIEELIQMLEAAKGDMRHG